MSISYSAWTFYGALCPDRSIWEDGANNIYDIYDVLRPLELRKIKENKGIDIGSICLHGFDEPGVYYLTFGEVYGGDLNHTSNDMLNGVRISGTIDEEYAKSCLAEVFEKLRWDFTVAAPGWYTGGTIS